MYQYIQYLSCVFPRGVFALLRLQSTSALSQNMWGPIMKVLNIKFNINFEDECTKAAKEHCRRGSYNSRHIKNAKDDPSALLSRFPSISSFFLLNPNRVLAVLLGNTEAEWRHWNLLILDSVIGRWLKYCAWSIAEMMRTRATKVYCLEKTHNVSLPTTNSYVMARNRIRDSHWRVGDELSEPLNGSLCYTRTC